VELLFFYVKTDGNVSLVIQMSHIFGSVCVCKQNTLEGRAQTFDIMLADERERRER
jgi:hypothetical protein